VHNVPGYLEHGKWVRNKDYDRFKNPQCKAGKIHIIFSTVCTTYGDWQAEGLVYSYYVTQMQGTITRISSCSNPNYTYPEIWHPCYSMHVLPDRSGKVRPPADLGQHRP
jgi:hypothetical protein